MSRQSRTCLAVLGAVTAIVSLCGAGVPAAADSTPAQSARSHVPVITALSVKGGTPRGGTGLIITGRHLGKPTSVRFGGVKASDFSRRGDGSIYAVTPAHASGTVHVQIVTASGRTAANAASRYVYVVPSRGATATWSAPRIAGAASGGLDAVQCPAVTFCVAADGYGNVAYFDGSSWSKHHKVDGRALYELSCPTRTFCMAIDSQGRTLQFDGSGWTQPQPLLANGQVTLSCGSATLCVAMPQVDQYRYFDGSTWSAHQAVPDLPAGEQTDGFSCGPSRCVVGTTAVGDTTPAHLLGFDGSAWTDLGEYQVRDENDDFAAVSKVSCPTDQFCALFDSADSVSFLNGSTVSHTRTISGDDLSSPLSISCSSPTLCMLVNEDDDAADAVLYAGHGWHAVPGQRLSDDERSVSCAGASLCVVTADGLARVYRGGALSAGDLVFPSVGLQDISCVTRTFCLTTDANGSVARFDGKRFGPARQVVHSGEYYTYVACATRSWCAVASGTRAAVFNGTKWSASRRIDRYRLTDIACGGGHECIAVDGHGRVVESSGSHWGKAKSIDPGHHLISASCSGSLCAAIDREGDALVRRDGRWSGRHVVYPTDGPTDYVYANVSCGSTHLCVIANLDGTAAKYDGQGWHRPVGVTGPAGTGGVGETLQTDVSCASSRFCLVAENARKPRALSFDGSTWSNAHAMGLPKDDAPLALSCASPHWCLAQTGDFVNAYSVGTR